LRIFQSSALFAALFKWQATFVTNISYTSAPF
jgi:hypothetical protein